MRDNVAPAAVVITSPSVNPYASGDTLFTLSGTCETAASVTLAGAQSGAATCMNGTFQFDIGKSQNGTYDYMLAQRDRAGNTSLPRAFRWQRDASIPPTPVLSSPLVNPYIASGSNLTVAGSCMGTNPVRIRGDAVADATCASGAFSMSINAASDGTYAFQATQASAVNGSSAAAVSLVWTRASAASAAPSLTSVLRVALRSRAKVDEDRFAVPFFRRPRSLPSVLRTARRTAGPATAPCRMCNARGG